jgi:hypothetical protein
MVIRRSPAFRWSDYPGSVEEMCRACFCHQVRELFLVEKVHVPIFNSWQRQRRDGPGNCGNPESCRMYSFNGVRSNEAGRTCDENVIHEREGLN